MGGKILPINKDTQAEEEVSQRNKTSGKNDQRKSISVKVNIKWCAQDKINNKQK